MLKKDSLLVCWKLPANPSDRAEAILSFLNPAQEEELRNKFSGKLISAGEASSRVKNQALKIYVDLVARIAATPIKKGETFRQALKNEEGISLWWFHKASNKDCEKDPTFRFIIEILSIISVARLHDSKRIVLFGGYKELGEVLKKIFPLREISCRRKYGFMNVFIRGILSRVKYSIVFLRQWSVIRNNLKAPASSLDAVFSGFWDWSVKEDKTTGKVSDCYFKSLPEELLSRAYKPGWFLWFDPYVSAISGQGKLKDILQPLKKHYNLVVLQCFIGAGQLVKAIANLKPYFIFLSFSKDVKFKEAFVVKEIDFYPILRGALSRGFLNSTIPHFELVFAAAKRAFAKYKPKISISFLELFLHSRAFYAGAKEGSPDTINYAMQHASYSREKTFVLFDSHREHEGFPDNCSLPKPDYLFAMGELGRDIFAESGFSSDSIFLTGSSRYEYVKNTNILRSNRPNKFTNLLMVATLNRDLEMAMVEAVCAAVQDLPQVRLFLRNHPFSKMEEHPKFHIYKEKIEISNNTLEEDLKAADLIIFSYSTVAEEALIRGVPVWQWVSASYNGSVFRDLKVIPSFYSVSDLRRSLKDFISGPARFIPGNQLRDFVTRKCFYAADGRASQRIADYIEGSFVKEKQFI